MATITVEQIRRVVTQYESRGADKAAADLAAIAAAEGSVARAAENMATITERSTKRQLDASTAAERVRLKYDEQYKLTQMLAREHRALATAVDAGRMSADDYVQTLTLMHARYGIVTEAQAALNGQLERENTLRARLALSEKSLSGMGRASAAAAPLLNEQANDRLRNLGTTVARNEAAAVAELAAEYSRLNVQAERALGNLGKMSAAPLNERANDRLRNMGQAVARAEAAALATVGEQIQTVREKYIPLVALQRRYKETLDDINQSAKLGALTEDERANAIGRTKVAFAAQVTALRSLQDAGAGVRLASHEVTNLGYQINDIATMLASGSSPFQVLATQGGQVYQVLAGDGRGLLGGFKALGGTIGGLVSPAGLAVGAVAAIGVAAAASYASWLAGEKQLQAALHGRGAATRATIDDLNAIAVAAAAAGDATAGEAREIIAALASTGKIGTELYEGLVDVTRRYAEVTKSDLASASEDIAKAFAKPGQGAEDLNEKLSFLDSTTLKYIRDVANSNRTHEAAALLLQKLDQVLPSASANLTLLGKAWLAVRNMASDAYTAMGRGIDALLSGPSLEEHIAVLEQRRAEIEAAIERNPNSRYRDRWADNLRQNTAELSKAYADRAMVEKRGEDARRSTLESEARAIVGSRDPRVQQLKELQEQQAKLRDVLGSGVAPGGTAAALEGVTNQIRAMTDAYGNLVPQAERVRREQELQNAVTAAVTTEQRAAAQAALERFRAEAEGADNATVSARANAAASQEMVQAQVEMTRATRDRLMAADESTRAQQLEIQLIGKTAGQVAELRANYEAEADLRRQAAETGISVSEQELAALRAKNAELGRSVDLAARANLQADIQFEREQLGRNPVDQQIASTLRASGLAVDLDSAEAAGLRLNATLSATKDLLGGVASSFLNDVLEGKSAVDALNDAFKRVAGTLLDMAVQNLVASAFGQSGGGGATDWLTSLVGGFLNFGSPSASVVATSTGRYAGPLAGGGLIRGEGTGTSDSIVARVSNGEFVVNAAATAAHRPLLEAINDNAPLPAFAKGGHVGARRRLYEESERAALRSAQVQAAQVISAPNINVRIIPTAGETADVTETVGADGAVDIEARMRRMVRGELTKAIDEGHVDQVGARRFGWRRQM